MASDYYKNVLNLTIRCTFFRWNLLLINKFHQWLNLDLKVTSNFESIHSKFYSKYLIKKITIRWRYPFQKLILINFKKCCDYQTHPRIEYFLLFIYKYWLIDWFFLHLNLFTNIKFWVLKLVKRRQIFRFFFHKLDGILQIFDLSTTVMLHNVFCDTFRWVFRKSGLKFKLLIRFLMLKGETCVKFYQPLENFFFCGKSKCSFQKHQITWSWKKNLAPINVTPVYITCPSSKQCFYLSCCNLHFTFNYYFLACLLNYKNK